MKTIKKVVMLLLYLVIVSLLLGFRLRMLIDVKQFFLVLLGMLLLYFPLMSRKEKEPLMFRTLGECALYASMIQSFLLIFVMLTTVEGFDGIMYELALNIRPLLYGFCIWVILTGADDKKETSVESEEKEGLPRKELTAEECYDRFLTLGLTRRETEVALLVCRGLTNSEIAAELSISEMTVKKHMSNIFAKLELTKREQLRQRLKE